VKEGRLSGVALWFWFPPTPPAQLAPGAGGSVLPRQPWPPRPPRPTARDSPWALGRRRAGAAGQDTALLAPPGAAGAPGQPLCPGCWGERPAATPDARSSGEQPLTRGRGAPMHPAGSFREARRGSLYLQHWGKRRFSPAQHPRTRTLRVATGSLT
jgi:hypothetical protein